jgi:sugar/nucleoside kinase (ribokinase family)
MVQNYLITKKRYVTGAFEVDKVIDPTGAGDCFIGGISGFFVTI